MKLRLSLAVAALFIAGTASAQTANEIVKKHIDAVGGADAWKKVTSMKMTGSISAQGMDIPVTMQTIEGKGMRLDMEIMGSKNYQILTKTEGWAYMPVSQMTSPQALTPEQVKAGQEQLELGDNLVTASEKGSKVELSGKETVDGTECFKLKLTRKDGGVVTEYVDSKTFYIVKETKNVKVEGKDVEGTTSYKNYQKLPEGIVVPMSIESGNGPIVLKSVEVNTVKDESIFKPTS